MKPALTITTEGKNNNRECESKQIRERVRKQAARWRLCSHNNGGQYLERDRLNGGHGGLISAFLVDSDENSEEMTINPKQDEFN